MAERVGNCRLDLVGEKGVETTPTAGGFVRADDRQISGTHYKTMKVQPWTAMEALLTREEFIGFLKGSIVKYSMRQGRKDGSDDGEKARHYIQKLGEVVGVLTPAKKTGPLFTPQEALDFVTQHFAARGVDLKAVEEGWCNGK